MEKIAISGGFDPIHIGHVRYIQEASKLGKLIVIVNSDKFLKKKKGFIFMPLKERMEIIKAISGVNEVVACIDEDQTVCKTLEMIKPDIFAKGGDRTLDNTPETDICRKLGIKVVFNVGGEKIQSSSDLVKKTSEVKKW